MKTLLILPSYIGWHYSEALLSIWGITTNFMWFLYHFFSVPILARTLFAPWHKLGEKYKNGLNAGNFFSTLFLNTILRVIGFVIRSAVLLFAFILMTGAFFAAIAFYILWIFFPVILLLLFINSVSFFSI